MNRIFPLKHFLSFVALAVVMNSQAQSPPSATTGDEPSGEAIPADDAYVAGPDSKSQPNVPAGKSFDFTLEQSKIFPGTTRTITVYIPAQYRPDKPACVYVNLDGLGYRAPIVFDNLIFKKQMPVTIGIGVAPGETESSRPSENPRHNRSYEFDSMSDRLARFLLEEVFPAVESQKTPDGLAISLSKNPNDRAIGGGSTGAIAAFTAAWQRPDAFRRVFTSIGTFVGMRGGDQYPVLVRKTEPKSIRIFMQDGSNDQWRNGYQMGDWWVANQTMEKALKWAGYEVEHDWGTGYHTNRHAKAIFPDVMRWLWKDWPQPVKAPDPSHPILQKVLAPGESWQVLNEEGQGLSRLTCDQSGILHALKDDSIVRIEADGKILPLASSAERKVSAFAFGPAGNLIVAEKSPAKILSLGPDNQQRILAENMTADAIVPRYDGTFYLLDASGGRIWQIGRDGQPALLDGETSGAAVAAFTPDELWLFAGGTRDAWGNSYQVRPDGTLHYREPYYIFNVPSWANGPELSGAVMDQNGFLYTATNTGIQIFDRNGRVTAILPLPASEAVTGLAFGGADFSVLYACTGKKIYQRKMQSSGIKPGAKPIPLPPVGKG